MNQHTNVRRWQFLVLLTVLLSLVLLLVPNVHLVKTPICLILVTVLLLSGSHHKQLLSGLDYLRLGFVASSPVLPPIYQRPPPPRHLV